jgi:multidrug efflux system membrane fusion protein
MASFNAVDPLAGEGRGSRDPRLPQSERKTRWWLWVLIVILCGFGGMGAWLHFASGTGDAAAQTRAVGARARGTGGPPAIPVVVAAVQRGDLPVYFDGLGTVTAFYTVTVHTRVDGQLDQVLFKEGQFVHQGDLLVTIDPRPFQVQLEQAQGQLAKDEAQRRDAQVNADRYMALYKAGVISKQQTDTQEALVQQFDGAIQTDQAQIDNAKLQLVYCHVTSPITGRVGLRLIDPGNIVHASDVNGLVVITQLQPIAVIFTLPQDQLPQVYAKLRAGEQLPADAYDREDVNKIEAGKLLTIDNQIDTTTGTYRLKAVFQNANNVLFPNQFVNVHLLVDVKHGLLVFPAAAVQRGPQGTYVYAVDTAGTAHIRPVTVALTSGDKAGITAGLDPGVEVVTDGQDRLQEGSKVAASFAPGTGGGSTSSAQSAGGQASPGRSGGRRQTGGQSQ